MKRFFLLLTLCIVFISGYSQVWIFRRYEIWGAVSVFQYFGDIGGTADKKNLFGLKDISLKANRPGITIGGIYRVDNRWYVQASNSLGFFTQTDVGSRYPTRNYQFNTLANETSVQGVFFIIKESDRGYSFAMKGKRSGLNQPFSFYAFAGVGSIYYKVTPNDNLVNSGRYLGTKHLSVTFPIGLGAKMAITPEYSLAAELGRRFTPSDYLDGFTSNFSKHSDTYYVLNIKFFYRFKRAKPSRPIF